MGGEANNDRMLVPRAMTPAASGGRACGPAPAPPPSPPPKARAPPPPAPRTCPPAQARARPAFIKNFTLIRLCLHFLRVISYLRLNANAISLVRVNFNFSKRPLVKLKTVVYISSLRTRTLCYHVKSLLVKAIVQLFVVAKCRLRRSSAPGAGRARARALAVAWLCASAGLGEGRRDNDLHIGGIFPMEGEGGWQGGQACMPAAELALADVNARSDLLSGFKLRLHSNDSKVCNTKFNPESKER